MKFAFLCIYLLFDFAGRAQTCIIIYVSDNGITAGADRKYRQTLITTDAITGKQKTNRSFYYGKKIFTDKSCCWALSGADFYDTIHNICKEVNIKSWSLHKIINRFTKRLQGPGVKKAMHELFLISNEEQKKRFSGNLTQVAFFKFDNNRYRSYRITLSMPGIFANNETIKFELDSIIATKKTFGIAVLGHYDAFSNNSKKESWKDPVLTIRKLIRKQSVYTPGDVSPESDIIQITRSGFKWLKRN